MRPVKFQRADTSRFITVWFVLFLFWILVSSEVDLQHVFVGAAASLAVSYYSFDLLLREGEGLPKTGSILPLVRFFISLAFDVIKANIHVAKIVLDPRLPISPSIVKFKTRLTSDNLKAALANSITLTPGTITIDIIGDTFYVHALTREAAEDVANWPIEDILMEVENAA